MEVQGELQRASTRSFLPSLLEAWSLGREARPADLRSRVGVGLASVVLPASWVELAAEVGSKVRQMWFRTSGWSPRPFTSLLLSTSRRAKSGPFAKALPSELGTGQERENEGLGKSGKGFSEGEGGFLYPRGCPHRVPSLADPREDALRRAIGYPGAGHFFDSRFGGRMGYVELAWDVPAYRTRAQVNTLAALVFVSDLGRDDCLPQAPLRGSTSRKT